MKRIFNLDELKKRISTRTIKNPRNITMALELVQKHDPIIKYADAFMFTSR